MKLKILFIFLVAYLSSTAQNKNIFFKGEIVDATKAIKNVHVINLTNNKGTFSNESGFFSIPSKTNDTLKITAIGFKTKRIIIKPFHIREYKNVIVLEKEIYNLDEIVLKKHNLSGFLTSDIKKTRITYKEKAVESLVEQIKNMTFYDISKMPVDFREAHLTKPTEVRLPDNKFEGFGTAIGLGSVSKTKSISEKLEEEKQIPDKILSEIGSYFFFTELKIPEEKYYHFITFCSFKNLFELYKKKKKFKVIQLLKQESKTYLKAIKEK
ncbi:carboxypeptidase-like regulatory domain-containing protein [Polaribacter sp.]|uniref:carboxypeptidase-like regulatory domain-containing protein n=1 Tax=Polaribacter sp. TaxID=1920175 RepID=UPI003F6AC3E8